MTYLSEAHNDWHTVYGWDVVCPLDCGVGEAESYWNDLEAEVEKWNTLDPNWEYDQLHPEQMPSIPEQYVSTVSAQDWADLQTILDWEVFEGFGR